MTKKNNAIFGVIKVVALAIAATLLIRGEALALIEFKDLQAINDGLVKPGCWSCLVATIENTEPGQNVKAELKLHHPTLSDAYVKKEILIPGGGVHKFVLPFKLREDEFWDVIRCDLSIDGGMPRSKTAQVISVKSYSCVTALLSCDGRMYDPGVNQYLSWLENRQDEEGEPTGDQLLVLNADTAPSMSMGYDIVDTLVISNTRGIKKLDVMQRRAIKDFVTSGGRLVIVGGRNAQYLKGTFIEDMAGIKFLSSSTGNASVILKHKRWADAPPPPVPLEVSSFQVRDAFFLPGYNDLITFRRYGRGEVTFIAYDPTSLFQWTQNKFTFDRVLKPVNRYSGDKTGRSAKNILNEFCKIEGKNVAGLIGLIILFSLGYAMIIGPLDYVFLKHFNKIRYFYRSFIGIIVVTGLFSFLIGSLFIQAKMRARYVAYIDVADDVPVSGGIYFSLFSPVRGTHRISVGDEGNQYPLWVDDRDANPDAHALEEDVESLGLECSFRNQESMMFCSRFHNRPSFNVKPSSFQVSYAQVYNRRLKKNQIRYYLDKAEFTNPLDIRLSDSYLVVGGEFNKYVPLGAFDAGQTRKIGTRTMAVAFDSKYEKRGELYRDGTFIHHHEREFYDSKSQWKISEYELKDIISVAISHIRPNPSNEEGAFTSSYLYHRRLCSTGHLRDWDQGVIVGFAKNYKPLEINVEGWSPAESGYTIVRIPVRVKVKR